MPAQQQQPADSGGRGAVGERANGPVVGYLASQSATGTKTDTPILTTPQSISVVTKDQIAQAWAGDGNEVGAGNTAEVHIHRLRRKLEGSSLVIRTVRGIGYLLEAEPGGAPHA